MIENGKAAFLKLHAIQTQHIHTHTHTEPTLRTIRSMRALFATRKVMESLTILLFIIYLVPS